MTLQQLHQQIGQIQRDSSILARALEIADRIAEMWGNPKQADAIARAAYYRGSLRVLFTRLHSLEARLPTPELLSAREYDRMLMLGMTIEAAEAGRVQAYRQAAHDQRYQHAA